MAQQLAHTGSWEWDATLNRLTWSDEMFRILGLVPQSVAPDWGRLLALVPWTDRKRLVRKARDAVRAGKPFYDVHRLRLPDGGERIVESRAQAVLDREGNAVRWAGAVQDVTERFHLQEEALRLAAIVAFANEAITGMTLDGVIKEWNPAAEALTGYSAIEVIGRPFTILAPPDRAGELAEVLDQVMRGKPVAREMVFRRKNGTAVPVMLRASPVRDAGGRIVRASAICSDITERKRAEAALRESEERERAKREELEATLSAIPAAVFIAEDAACTRMSANRAACGVMRLPEGANASKSAPAPEAPANFEVFSADGKFLKPEELPMQMAAASGHAIEAAEFELRFTEGDRKCLFGNALPLFSPQGDVRGAVGAFLDITERKRAEEQIRLLMREVNHRSKNLLTVALAIARQTAATNPEDFIRSFTDRVCALAISQDLLVKSEWRAVDLAELVQSHIAHFNEVIGTRIELQGPRLSISASAAQTIGMVLHELATNAGKYGALSNASGRVKIAWKLERTDGQETFVMSWREKAGPPVTPPNRQGFGSTIIRRMAENSLAAKVDLDYAPTGLRWQLKCPAAEVLGGSQWRSASDGEAAGRDGDAYRTAPCILVVEDEPLVALEIADMLKQAGFETLGPAGTVSQSLELLKSKRCDAAVLDINLGDETSELVALELIRLNTRFVSVSGYSRAGQPPVFISAPALAKPLRPELLIAEVKRCLTGHKELLCYR